ncbi:MAG: terpene cyclase/mutase family protein [Nitrososphaerota archaeon]|jgi:hypothetical protein|nr:terpene cyclase/mutase family protein [Nitrososphaerota archaeon]MDG6943178.1 terpene cyclase/mutase family protein [Nitrososphaerota archaeon]MDG6950944.1 terpene cyclase/mutase family protein [Nitrososphaerota archaeon]
MRDLVDGASMSELEEAKRAITARGWVNAILSRQQPGGNWLDKEDALYRPKYVSTNWMLLLLSDLGVTKEDSRVAKACALWMDTYARADGGFDTPGAENSEHCLVGNTARGLIKFGYADEPRVKTALDLLVKTQKDDGGWHCFPSSSGTLDAWEGMSAFAAYPRQKWTRGMKAAVEKGAEFFLERRLSRQGRRYDPWLRFHFPYHYYYDILVGLEFMTALGYGDDYRIKPALTRLMKKQREDGRWESDAVHPDFHDVRWPRWRSKYAGTFTAFSLEPAGQPSKMVTLRALKVLKRVGSLTSGSYH